ncbi:MAG: alpha/beta hydrolase [Clostridia bacterium]|nr:alpha/beta hydrolase [Clostridia bacterium]
MSIISYLTRKMFEKGDAKRDHSLTTPKDIVRFDNIPYGEGGEWNLLDVYRLRSRENEKLPVIVSVHGGGWVYGNKEGYQFYCMSLAEQGFAVVNFTYRLAPKFKFPAPVLDTNQVFHWLMEHAEEYGVDTDRIYAVGDSAGAQILGSYAAICTNSEYAKLYGVKVPEKLTIKAIALNCGVYQIISRKKTDGISLLLREYFPKKGNSEEQNMADFRKYITKDFPAVFVMTATGDFLKEEAEILIKELKEKCVPYQYRLYGDNSNRLGHVFHCDIQSADAIKCNLEECAFFHRS